VRYQINNITPKKNISQYKGVTWSKQRKKWRVQLCLKGQNQKFGGYFKDALDAAKRVNQICEELGIPPYNPDVVEMPTQTSPVTVTHDEFQTIANPVISTKLVKTAYDDAGKTKRKREKELMDDNKLPVEKHYSCDHKMK